MGCVKTRIFKSNRSQAVRLPKEVAFPESIRDVEIVAIGKKRIIFPVGQSWDDWFDGPGVSSDFMAERQQPDDQHRKLRDGHTIQMSYFKCTIRGTRADVCSTCCMYTYLIRDFESVCPASIWLSGGN